MATHCLNTVLKMGFQDHIELYKRFSKVEATIVKERGLEENTEDIGLMVFLKRRVEHVNCFVLQFLSWRGAAVSEVENALPKHDAGANCGTIMRRTAVRTKRAAFW